MRAFPAILLLVLAGIGACSPPRSVPLGAIRTTPAADLPVSNAQGIDPLLLPTALPDPLIQEADAEYLLLSNIYERSAPSVVNIETSIQPADGSIAGGVNRGSGFVFDVQGHIVTSAHVVRDARSIRITFQDGYVTQGELVGLDTYSDLAVIRVRTQLERLVPLSLMADSSLVRVGQRAIGIGNPFGLNSSMSAGIVSGIGRTLRSAELIDGDAPIGFQNPSIIQTDTPINPGNSGGPLLNSRGEVMGVMIAIRTDSGMFQGVGFAVPANTIRRVVSDLIAGGSVNYAWIGISVQPEENGFGVAGLADELDLPVSSGVLVRGVTIGGPADEAGLRGGDQIVQVRGESICSGGDLIVAINGTYVRNMDELITYLLFRTSPGERAILLVVRDGETFQVPVTLRERPDYDGTVRDCGG
jgi:S1-C subfamily serine protease